MHYIMTAYYQPQINYLTTPEPVPGPTVPLYEEVDSARRAATEISTHDVSIVIACIANDFQFQLQNINKNQEEVHYDDAQMTEINV